MSSRSSVLLYIRFVQIRRIAPSNTFTVLAIYYAKHKIDPIDSSTLQHNSVQTIKQAKRTFLPLSAFMAYLLTIQATK